MSFVVATTPAARDRGLAAGKLVPAFAPAVGGRGGGKPDLAQGGGSDPSGVPAAQDALRRALAAILSLGRDARAAAGDRRRRGARRRRPQRPGRRAGHAAGAPCRATSRAAPTSPTIAGLVAEHDVVGIVVGLPRTLAGREGPAAEAARAFAAALAGHLEAARVAVPLEFADERLTTVVATRQMRESGRKGRRQRAVVDQVAAVAILQGWLDARR